jgi:hypothetical protein
LWKAAGGEMRCSDGSRAWRTGDVETIRRPGKRDTRCWHGPGGVRSNDR